MSYANLSYVNVINPTNLTDLSDLTRELRENLIGEDWSGFLCVFIYIYIYRGIL